MTSVCRCVVFRWHLCVVVTRSDDIYVSLYCVQMTSMCRCVTFRWHLCVILSCLDDVYVSLCDVQMTSMCHCVTFRWHRCDGKRRWRPWRQRRRRRPFRRHRRGVAPAPRLPMIRHRPGDTSRDTTPPFTGLAATHRVPHKHYACKVIDRVGRLARPNVVFFGTIVGSGRETEWLVYFRL